MRHAFLIWWHERRAKSLYDSIQRLRESAGDTELDEQMRKELEGRLLLDMNDHAAAAALVRARRDAKP